MQNKQMTGNKGWLLGKSDTLNWWEILPDHRVLLIQVEPYAWHGNGCPSQLKRKTKVKTPYKINCFFVYDP